MTPNPGSDEAKTRGCTCPVLDNNMGTRAPFPPDGWWLSEGCSVHWGESEAFTAAEEESE